MVITFDFDFGGVLPAALASPAHWNRRPALTALEKRGGHCTVAESWNPPWNNRSGSMPQIRLDREDADGRLPMVCMRCGEPATVTRTRNMSWCPPWVGVLFLAGLIPYVIVAIIMTKRT